MTGGETPLKIATWPVCLDIGREVARGHGTRGGGHTCRGQMNVSWLCVSARGDRPPPVSSPLLLATCFCGECAGGDGGPARPAQLSPAKSVQTCRPGSRCLAAAGPSPQCCTADIDNCNEFTMRMPLNFKICCLHMKMGSSPAKILVCGLHGQEVSESVQPNNPLTKDLEDLILTWRQLVSISVLQILFIVSQYR